MESTSIAVAVGAFARAYRRQRRITLEAIARCSRHYGATWSVSSVQAIEEGRAAPTLPSLLTLALVLGELGGEPLTLADLLGSTEAFDKPTIDGAGQPAPRALIERALRGEPVVITNEDRRPVPDTRIRGNEPFGQTEEPADAPVSQRLTRVDPALESAVQAREGAPLTDVEMSDALDELVEQSQQPPEPEDDEEIIVPPSLAEARAAKKLDISTAELQQFAHRLWGQSMEAESMERAGRDSTPQARGRVTRVLVEELKEAVQEES